MNAEPNAFVYLPAVSALDELQQMSAAVASAGLENAPAQVGGSLADWLRGLPQNTEAWTYSLAEFRSVTELIAQNEALAERGVVLRSIQEPWFNAPDSSSRQTLVELFRLGAKLHRPVPAPARTTKTTLQSVQQAVELRRSRRLSVARACQLAGCSVAAYYQYLKKEDPSR